MRWVLLLGAIAGRTPVGPCDGLSEAGCLEDPACEAAVGRDPCSGELRYGGCMPVPSGCAELFAVPGDAVGECLLYSEGCVPDAARDCAPACQ